MALFENEGEDLVGEATAEARVQSVSSIEQEAEILRPGLDCSRCHWGFHGVRTRYIEGGGRRCVQKQ